MKLLKISTAIVIVALAIAIGYNYLQTPKVACVQLQKLYEEFELKKQAEGKFKNVSSLRKNVLDSMELQLKAKVSSIQAMNDKDKAKSEEINRFEYQKQEYLAKKKQFDEDNQLTLKSYEADIWKQLNQYVSDYGKENGFTCILGANGTGAVMYTEEHADITKDLVKYVNNKYSH